MQAEYLGVAPARTAVPVPWGLYFPGSDFNAQDRRAVLLMELAQYMGTATGWQLLSSGLRQLQQGYVLCMDVEALQRLVRGSDDLQAALELQPQEAIACIAAAAHEVCGERQGLACWRHCKGPCLLGCELAGLATCWPLGAADACCSGHLRYRAVH